MEKTKIINKLSYNESYKKSFKTKANKTIKESIIRDMMNLSQNKEEYYYKTVRINHFRSNNW